MNECLVKENVSDELLSGIIMATITRVPVSQIQRLAESTSKVMNKSYAIGVALKIVF
jgi:hypothetical protein